MLTEIFLAVLIGTIAGTITGLTPGIHINLVALLSFTISPFLLEYVSPLTIAIFIIAMSVTHTFTDFIPSTFLGAPDSDTALSVLPAHSLLLKGQAYDAIKLATIGSLFGLIITVLVSPLLIIVIPYVYPIIQDYIPFILITAIILLILKDHGPKLWALISFLLSGTLGIIVLTIYHLKEPLFPLLSGLFGTSMLLISLKDKVIIPKQTLYQSKIKKSDTVKALSSGMFASSLVGFLPGMSSAESAILASSTYKPSTKSFIILVGSINTIVMILSFIALYTIQKTRSGSIVIISRLLESINVYHLIIFMAVTLIVAGLATFITLYTAKIFSKIITKINYKLICISIMILITLLALIISGPLGLLVLIVSTSIGLIPPLKGIHRSHLMGCLILPVILFFML